MDRAKGKWMGATQDWYTGRLLSSIAVRKLKCFGDAVRKAEIKVGEDTADRKYTMSRKKVPLYFSPYLCEMLTFSKFCH